MSQRASRAGTPPLPKISKGEQKPPNHRNATEKLKGLANRFDGFEDALVLAKDRRKDENEQRFSEVHKLIVDLKTSLALEAKNRAISVTAVQSWLSDRIEQWTEEVQTPLLRKLDALNSRVDVVNKRLDTLEEEHQVDRETFPKLIDARAQELLLQIKDMQVKHEHNVKQREEKEHRILVKIQQQSDRFSEQFSAEKLLKEDQFRVLWTDLEAEVDVRKKGFEATKEKLQEETSDIRVLLDRERQEREQQHEEVLQAVKHYSAALQDGIKVVGLD